MGPAERRPVAVLGAGLAGVTAAAALRRNGVPVTLFEAGPEWPAWPPASRTRRASASDFGAHFITNRLAAAIGVGARCLDVRYYGESVLLRGSVYSYPFGLVRNPRFVLSGMRGRGPGNDRRPGSVAEYFRTTYGAALANEVAIPLVEAWSGAAAESLAPSVASEKLQHGVGALAGAQAGQPHGPARGGERLQPRNAGEPLRLARLPRRRRGHPVSSGSRPSWRTRSSSNHRSRTSWWTRARVVGRSRAGP